MYLYMNIIIYYVTSHPACLITRGYPLCFTPGLHFILMPDAGAIEHIELDAPGIIHLPWTVPWLRKIRDGESDHHYRIIIICIIFIITIGIYYNWII